jgi:peptide/nickel transport system substrate-binding protein
MVAGCDDQVEPEPEVTVARAQAPPHLDPALAADHDTLEALWLVYTPLLSYRHTEGESGTELIPGLASDLPELLDGGRVYKLTLRQDLVYDDGTPAVASDFERAVERDLRLGSPASPYLREIDDIDTNDESGEITITLNEPDLAFPYALALPATAPVPVDTPMRELSDDPPSGIGPYDLEVGEDGEVVLSQSDTFAELDIPDIPRGNVAKVTIEVISDDIERTAAVLHDEIDSIQGPPAEALEPEIASSAADRYAEAPAAATTYVRFDRRRDPFDDPAVREAARDAVDSTGCSLIPAGMPGYDHDYDTTGCASDVAAARALIRQAGVRGTPVTVGGDADRARRYAAGLRAIGLEPRLAAGGDADTAVVSQYASTPMPFDFFWAAADDPVVRARLADLRLHPESVGDWAALERYVLEPPQAYIVPLAHERLTTLLSSRLDPASAVVHPIFGNDLSSWRLQPGQ